MLFDKEELNKISIHELRIKAREVGVRSPTTKKQQDLINEIIKIQNGEMLPHKTNMGRPVKSNIKTDILKLVGTLAPSNYAPVMLEEGKLVYEDGQKVQSINDDVIFECCGVVRELNGNYYIQNYIMGCKYITMSALLKKQFNLVEGDFARCKAKFVDINFGELISVESKNFNLTNTKVLQEFKVEVKKNVKDMYSYINKDSRVNKIVLEIESNANAYNILDKNCILLNSKECDDIMMSFNVLLDCKNLVNNLCNNDVPFVLYVNDVEYIYSILKVYYAHLKMEEELNSGQYFKEILSIITNSKNGSIILFEKENSKRSSYLDIIINKYC